MSQAFDASLSLVLRYEGGYSNHPKDPGGATLKGITQRTLDGLRPKYAGLPTLVSDLSDQQIALIYRVAYWEAVQGDELPPAVALMAFDAAVQHSPATAIRLLQRAAGVAEDGIIGPATRKAVAKPDQSRMVKEYGARRMHYYMLMDSLDDTFGLGWSRRLVDVLDQSLTLTQAV